MSHCQHVHWQRVRWMMASASVLNDETGVLLIPMGSCKCTVSMWGLWLVNHLIQTGPNPSFLDAFIGSCVQSTARFEDHLLTQRVLSCTRFLRPVVLPVWLTSSAWHNSHPWSYWAIEDEPWRVCVEDLVSTSYLLATFALFCKGMHSFLNSQRPQTQKHFTF